MSGVLDEAMRTGKMSQEESTVAEACMCRSRGHCAVMGTASTMACMVESLGFPCRVMQPYPLRIRGEKCWRSFRVPHRGNG